MADSTKFTFRVDDVSVNSKLSGKEGDMKTQLSAIATKFYNSGEKKQEEKFKVEIEQNSSFDSNQFVHLKVSSLMETALVAFAEHYPLGLKPDDFWKAILFGFAKHVDQNAEKLRDKFVSHEGKKP